jgi:hypothetical protein
LTILSGHRKLQAVCSGLNRCYQGRIVGRFRLAARQPHVLNIGRYTTALFVELSNAREWADETLAPLFAEGFPAFITADHEAKKYIGRVREWFTDFDIMLVDEHDRPRAAGWGVPLEWNGAVSSLPAGYTDAIGRAVNDRESGNKPNTFVICGGIVHPEDKGGTVAQELIAALCNVASQHELLQVIAPVRPTRKHAYPLTAIDDYVAWTRHDGAPFDPWIRLHCRLGARVLCTAPASQTMTGSVAEWEAWTEMKFPQSGNYVVPNGLSFLSIDRELDRGTYIEPNVWVQHKQ